MEEEDDGQKEMASGGGTGLSIKKKSRARNFDSAEDVIIARCWRNMTNDPKIGTDQTSDVFWQRLFVKYTTVMMEEQKHTQVEINKHRSWVTLRSRWRRCIQKESMLFASIYRRVRAQEKSGWNNDDYEKEAMARYRAMSGKNKEFAYLECWKVLKEEPKFMLMIKSTTPNDEGIPAIISTDNGENIGTAEAEGDASAVTSASEAQQQSKQVRMSLGSYSSINGPPIGSGGRPMGVKKAKAGLKQALLLDKERRDIATERHEEVANLLTSIGQHMNRLAKQIDVQTSFLGSFVYLQMGETEKAQALAESGQTDLFVPQNGDGGAQASKAAAMKDGENTVGNEEEDEDDEDEKVYKEGENDDDDDDDENEKENYRENQKKRVNTGSGGDHKKKSREARATDAATRPAVFGYCAAGRRCGRFAETGGRLDRFNFSPNAGDDVEEIIEHPKHRCTGCCKAFCGGTCGIGESADDYICNDCLSMP